MNCVSRYVAIWPITDTTLDMDDLVTQAEEELPYILADSGTELVGPKTWTRTNDGRLVMAADGRSERGPAPWEDQEAFIRDLLPEIGWRPEWDQAVAA